MFGLQASLLKRSSEKNLFISKHNELSEASNFFQNDIKIYGFRDNNYQMKEIDHDNQFDGILEGSVVSLPDKLYDELNQASSLTDNSGSVGSEGSDFVPPQLTSPQSTEPLSLRSLNLPTLSNSQN